METCEHCGMTFINKACVTKHIRNGKCPKYVPPKTYAELQAENDKLRELETKAVDGCIRLREEVKAKQEEIEWLKPYYRFYKHIEAHLTSDEKVICKICGKTLKQIEQALKGK